MTHKELLSKGYEAFSTVSVLVEQYNRHSFPFKRRSGIDPGSDVYVPKWLFTLDQFLWRVHDTEEKFCCMCAVCAIYGNKALSEKWATLLTLDPTYPASNYAELVEDIKLAGLKTYACRVVYPNGL